MSARFSHKSAPSDPDEKELSGRTVLLSIIGFFAIVFIANGIFITLAVTSFTGEDVPKSYRQGLDYNSVLHDKAAQLQQNWDIRANHMTLKNGKTRVVVEIKDANNVPVSALDMNAQLRHPTDKTYDIIAPMTAKGFGRYEGEFDLPPGNWTFKASAPMNGDHAFRFTYPLWID